MGHLAEEQDIISPKALTCQNFPAVCGSNSFIFWDTLFYDNSYRVDKYAQDMVLILATLKVSTDN
jgi:hypothetical protein